jgi:hypothetical protein
MLILDPVELMILCQGLVFGKVKWFKPIQTLTWNLLESMGLGPFWTILIPAMEMSVVFSLTSPFFKFYRLIYIYISILIVLLCRFCIKSILHLRVRILDFLTKLMLHLDASYPMIWSCQSVKQLRSIHLIHHCILIWIYHLYLLFLSPLSWLSQNCYSMLLMLIIAWRILFWKFWN